MNKKLKLILGILSSALHATYIFGGDPNPFSGLPRSDRESMAFISSLDTQSRLYVAQADRLNAQNAMQGAFNDHTVEARKLELRGLKANAEAQEIVNQRAKDGLFAYLSRPETIFKISVALAPVIIFLIREYRHTNSAQKIVEQQKIELNNITVEQAKIGAKREKVALAREELALEQDKKKFNIEDIMIKFALEDKKLALQEKHTRVKVLSILTVLADKKAQGHELSEREQEVDQTLNQMLNTMMQSKKKAQETASAAA